MRAIEFLLGCVLLSPSLALSDFARFKLPPYEKVILDNGLTLYLLQQDEVPLVSVSTVIRAGAEHDGNQLGLAGLTLDGLQMGISDLSKQALEDLFEFHGADITTHTGPDAASLSLSLASKDVDKLLPVYLEMLRHPTFPQQNTEKLIKLHQQKLRRRIDSPKQVIHQYFYRMLFNTHLYGNPVEGTLATVSKINPANLKLFHQTFFQPKQIAIAIAGDFDTKALKSTIRSLIGDWKNKPTPQKDSKPIRFAEGTRVLVVNKPDSSETTIQIGGKGIARSNPDYVQLQVINSVIGQGFTSWLMEALRVDAGLTYSARSQFRPLRQGGAFYISTFTQTDTTFQTVDLALATYDRLLQGELNEDTLQSAKNYMVGRFPTHFERSSDLSLFLADMYIYDFDESYVNTFKDKVNGLTLAKANKLIKQYFPRNNLVIVLIGQADVIADSAVRYGKVHRLRIADGLPAQIR
jgi:zinc protease